jgi:hypothetical protein
VRDDLAAYVRLASRLGFHAESRWALGTDLVNDLENLCSSVVSEREQAIVFTGQLVFQRENLLSRTLHHETSFAIQRRLQFRGIQVIILPIRVWERLPAHARDGRAPRARHAAHEEQQTASRAPEVLG